MWKLTGTIFLVSLFWIMVIPAFSQLETTQRALTFGAFTDIYYAFDFNKPANHQRPDFLYNHNRHNEFNINLALLQAHYSSGQVRGNLSLMVGTYAQYNLAAEPEILRNIYEANVGIKLAKNIWLDAGVFPSHIGLESAVSKDNITLTRSLAAENSPYYESGMKLTYEAGSKWVLTGLILNGWQNIQEPPGNSNKAIGTQIQFKPSDKILINSSTFVGNEKPDSTKQKRYFHDFYFTFQMNSRLKLAGLFDIGAEKRLNTDKYNVWYSPVLLLHYTLSDKVAIGARVEHYNDKNGVIISSDQLHGFRTSGYSLNLDYAPAKAVLMRVEGRLFDSKAAIFMRDSWVIDKAAAVTCSAAISF